MQRESCYGSMIGNAVCSPVKAARDLSVSGQLTLLEDRVACLDSAVANLEGALAGVLRPEQTSEALRGEGVANDIAPLVMHMNAVIHRVGMITDRVNSVQDRLSVS